MAESGNVHIEKVGFRVEGIWLYLILIACAFGWGKEGMLYSRS